MGKIGGGSPSTGYKLLHRIVRLGMSDRVIVFVSPSFPLMTLFAPPPFCERTSGLQTTPRRIILEPIYASTRYAPIQPSPHQPTPLGITESPIRYQNNSHLFVVRPATPSFRVAIMKCRRMQ